MAKRKTAASACTFCGSLRVLEADYFEAWSGLGAGGVRPAGGLLVTAKVPLGGRRNLLKKSPVAVEVCVDCGTIRLRATDLRGFARRVNRKGLPHGDVNVVRGSAAGPVGRCNEPQNNQMQQTKPALASCRGLRRSG